jgi:hypothetical protein
MAARFAGSGKNLEPQMHLAQPMAATEQQKGQKVSRRRGSHWCRRITSRQSKKGF